MIDYTCYDCGLEEGNRKEDGTIRCDVCQTIHFAAEINKRKVRRQQRTIDYQRAVVYIAKVKKQEGLI